MEQNDLPVLKHNQNVNDARIANGNILLVMNKYISNMKVLQEHIQPTINPNAGWLRIGCDDLLMA